MDGNNDTPIENEAAVAAPVEPNQTLWCAGHCQRERQASRGDA